MKTSCFSIAKKRLSLKTLLILAFFLGLGFSLQAEPQPSSSPSTTLEKQQQFENVLQKVSQKREFTWKQPREISSLDKEKEELSAFGKFWKSFKIFIKAVADWFEEVYESIFGKDFGVQGDSAKTSFASTTLLSFKNRLNHLTLGLVIALIFHFRKRKPKLSVETRVSTETPDLESIHTQATDLPVGEWETLALSLMEKGDWRLAARAWYLGGLALLHEQGLIRVKRGKSNADYLSETKRYVLQRPEVFENFRGATQIFEKVWYGFSSLDEQEPRTLQSWVHALRKEQA